jgi:hypothetical protein
MNENTNAGSEAILSYAAAIAGDGADDTLLQAMCVAAASELEARLREGVSAEQLGETFSLAAGVLAASMYCATEHPERIRRFRAGEVSVAYEKATPESLRTAAEEMLAAYLQDRGFDFRGVRG